MFTLFQNQINSNTLKSLLDITGKGNIDDLIDTSQETTNKVPDSVLLEYFRETSAMIIAIRNNTSEHSKNSKDVYHFYKGTVQQSGELQDLKEYAKDITLSSFITFLKLDALKWHQTQHPEQYQKVRTKTRGGSSTRTSRNVKRKGPHPSQIIYS